MCHNNFPLESAEFEMFYRATYANALKYVLRRVSDVSAAEDLLQEAFLSCYRNRHRFDPQRSSITTWFYTSVNNRIKNYYRDKNTSDPLENISETLFANCGEDIALQSIYIQQLRESLANVLQSLPPKHQKMIIMRYFQGYSTKEIAAHFNITPENVRVTISRALAKIRDSIHQNMTM